MTLTTRTVLALTEPTPVDMFSDADGVTLWFVGVACLAIVLAAALAVANAGLRAKRWQDRQDLQTERNTVRAKDAELRRLRWNLAQLQGFQPTAQQHLGLNDFVDEEPEHGPAWVGPSWCYEPLPPGTPDLGAGFDSDGIATLADQTERFNVTELRRLLDQQRQAVA